VEADCELVNLPATPVAPTARTTLVSAARTLCRVALGAVDGPVIARLEGHLRVLPTLATNSREHFALPAAEATAVSARCEPAFRLPRLASGTTLGASARVVGKALLGEELLLADREGELVATVATGKDLVLERNHADSFGIF
jgi:hypothetical protein